VAGGLPLIVDSTVATPACFGPCVTGRYCYSVVTKTLASSGSGVCGAVIARKDLISRIDNADLKKDFGLYIKYLPNRDYGPNLHPLQALMAMNDIRTVRSKMDMMSRSTMAVAEYLEKHPSIESVQYLGLKSHPLHDLASQYMWLVDAEHDAQYGKPISRYGHLMSFCVKGGVASRAFLMDSRVFARNRPRAD
jgi:O-acetylhomoserine/O-acetylserine sulfhydrylase-like pyridoxal-dependent enzyme